MKKIIYTLALTTLFCTSLLAQNSNSAKTQEIKVAIDLNTIQDDK